jgi:hypothetical protein
LAQVGPKISIRLEFPSCACTLRSDQWGQGAFSLQQYIHSNIMLWKLFTALPLSKDTVLFIFQTTFQRQNSVSCLQVKPAHLDPIDRAIPIPPDNYASSKMGYTRTNQTQNKPSARARKNIKLLKLHTYKKLHQRSISTEIITREKQHFLWYQHKKNIISHSNYTWRSCNFLTAAMIMGVQIGETSKLGSLVGWSSRHMWADSKYFLYVVLGSICNTFASFQHILWPSSYACMITQNIRWLYNEAMEKKSSLFRHIIRGYCRHPIS